MIIGTSVQLDASILNPAASVVHLFFSTLTTWLGAGAASIVASTADALDATTSVTFGDAFGRVYDAMRVFGGELALPFLVLAVIHSIVRGEVAALVRTVIVKVPIALAGSAAAIWIVQEALAATDQLSSALLQGNGSAAGFASGLEGALSGPGSVLAGFSGVLVALLAAVAALFLLLELEIRASAVSAAALFLPLALSALIWPATAHWIRRLGETLGALVLAKVVMVGVLVLALTTLAAPTGVAGALQGVALLLLASLAPWSLLRLLPFVDAATSLDGLSRRGAHLATRTGALVGAALERFGSDDITPFRPEIPTMAPADIDPSTYDAAYAEALDQIERWRSRSEGAGGE